MRRSQIGCSPTRAATFSAYTMVCVAAALFAPATAHEIEAPPASAVHENGVGPDPDGDSNPATVTRGFSRIGDAAEAADDLPHQVITFEAPPGAHGEKIRKQYEEAFGVAFGPGLTQQICEGQRYFRYDSMCTYFAAPSGKYAAGYGDALSRPLIIDFDAPICLATMAIYPTGGEEEERFELTLLGRTVDDAPLGPAVITFTWTDNTIRWRHMAGVYFLGEKARRLEINMRSLTNKKRIVCFLIDDFAFIEDACEAAFLQIADEDSVLSIGVTADDEDEADLLEDDQEAEEEDDDAAL